jgi:hypothetical protein
MREPQLGFREAPRVSNEYSPRLVDPGDSRSTMSKTQILGLPQSSTSRIRARPIVIESCFLAGSIFW